jgi:HK97 family phage portal protein
MLFGLFGGGPRADAGDSDRSVFGNFWFQPLGLRSAAGVRVTATTAMALPAVYSAVKVLAESFAVMPFELYRVNQDNDRRKRQRKHWLYRVFAKRPNPFQDPFSFRLMLMGHLALRGNAFCQITANGSGEITELLPLHPDRMTVEMLPSGDYRYRYTDQTGRALYYPRGEIWHLKGLSDDGIMGLSPLECAREAIGEGLAMQAYSSRFFANDAKPGGGWIEYPGSFKDQTTKQAWRDSWQKMQGGANRHKVAVLERGMKFHELGLKNSDSQFVEGRQLKIADIARIFRVPPHMIGDLSRATFSNIEQQSIDFWTGTMLPYAELWESSIEFFLLGQGLGGPDDDLEAEFDMDRMMRGDAVARGTYYGLRTQWGSITPNEVRARENEEPLPWLNYTMRPVNMAKMDANGEMMTLPAGKVGATDPDGDDTEGASAPPSRKQSAQAAAVASVARLRTLIEGNVKRMARRIAAGNVVPADQLAEALAIDEDTARDWLANVVTASEDEAAIARELMGIALETSP